MRAKRQNKKLNPERELRLGSTWEALIKRHPSVKVKTKIMGSKQICFRFYSMIFNFYFLMSLFHKEVTPENDLNTKLTVQKNKQNLDSIICNRYI